jgi:hypothetical protein
MEAVRTSQRLAESEVGLPPPPAPFPTELLMAANDRYLHVDFTGSRALPIEVVTCSDIALNESKDHDGSSSRATEDVAGSNSDNKAEMESLPPRYSSESYHITPQGPVLPDYQEFPDERPLEKGQNASAFSPALLGNLERTIHDLDDITTAIERLQHLAPQLQDQRVENPVAGPSRLRNGDAAKARSERDKMRELEEIWDKIERAHARRGVRERINLEDYEQRRAERVSRASFD